MGVLSCIADRKNIGKSSCKKLPQLIKGIITTPSSFSLTEVEAATSQAWQDAILAAKGSRVYLWPYAVNMENVNEEAVYEETSLSTQAVRDGRYRFRLSFRQNLEVHKAMFSHKNFDGRVFLIDDENKIIGTELENGNFAGFNLDLLNPEKLTFNDGSVTSKTPVYISLEDNRELDNSGSMIDGSFLKSLVPLTSVAITVDDAAATEINVTVLSALDNEPVLGLIVDDFVLLDASGASQSITTVTDNDDGTYTLAGSAFVAGTLDLVSAATLSVVGFENPKPVDVTI